MIKIIKEYYLGISGMEPYVNDKIEKLERNKDIMEEFAYWISNNQYRDKGVVVEGYKAKELANISKYLVGEGSFMLMIELRENPNKAKQKIMDGFKMK